ncbi:TPA: hypothetical protein ACH3X1_007072 [Trebouxia sp. C0004]
MTSTSPRDNRSIGTEAAGLLLMCEQALLIQKNASQVESYWLRRYRGSHLPRLQRADNKKDSKTTVRQAVQELPLADIRPRSSNHPTFDMHGTWTSTALGDGVAR